MHYSPSPDNWTDFIPETDELLQPNVGTGYIFANYFKDAISRIKQYDSTGKLVREIDLPGKGTASGLALNPRTRRFTMCSLIT